MKLWSALFAFMLLALSLAARAETIRPWSWMVSDCQDCGVKVVIYSAGSNKVKIPDAENPLKLVEMRKIENEKVEKFVRTLEKYKSEIIDLYHSDSQEYNLLAHMAIGILGNESEFFTSFRFFLKRNGSGVITGIKKVRSLVDDDYEISQNSSGPTQIKVVPKKIAEKYGVTQATLRIWPEHAAVATIGYLIEALQELKRRAINSNLDFITPETYIDYLPYIYMGRTRLLMSGKAEPHNNKYILRMKHYMNWVQLYEVHADK
jgi:hypothetical protein